MDCVELFQLEVGGLATAITYHQHRYLVRRCAACQADPASLTGRPGQLTLTFEGFQKEGFVSLDDAVFLLRCMAYSQSQKTMPPAKCRVLADASGFRRTTHGQPFDQRVAVIQPVTLHVQASQTLAC